MQVLRPGVREHAAQALLTIASGPPPPLADEVLAAIAAVVHSERNRGQFSFQTPGAPGAFPGNSSSFPSTDPFGGAQSSSRAPFGAPGQFFTDDFSRPGQDGGDWTAEAGAIPLSDSLLLLGFHTRLLWRRRPQHPDPASCFYVNPAPVFYELLSASVISRFLTVRARLLRRGAPPSRRAERPGQRGPPRVRRARGAEQAAADALDTGGDADGARAAADPLRPRLAAVRPSGIAGGASVTASFLLPLFVASRAPGAPAPVASPPNPAAAERGSAE
eukprot:gene17310-biopygen7651